MSDAYLPPSGGCPIIRPDPLVYHDLRTQGLTLISDCHIGASILDESLLKEDLDKASLMGDRVLLGGDIFDIILPSDRKRYCPSAIHPKFQGRDDLMNVVTEYATELFRPYVDLIDLIGIGNHETEAVYRHCYDPVRQLVQNLNQYRSKDRKPIAEAGYTAYVSYGLRPVAFTGKARTTGEYVIWYHHGSGKCSNNAGALRNLRQKANYFSADLYWSGHSHTRGSATERTLLPGSGGLCYKDVKLVITGSYLQIYGAQSQENMQRKGRRSNYASESAMTGSGLGGARITLGWVKGSSRPRKVVVEI